MISSKALVGLAGLAVFMTVGIYATSNSNDEVYDTAVAKTDKLKEIELKENDAILRALAVKNKKIHSENIRIKQEISELKEMIGNGSETHDQIAFKKNAEIIEKLSNKINSLENRLSSNITKTKETISEFRINKMSNGSYTKESQAGGYIDLDAMGNEGITRGSSQKERMLSLHKRILGSKKAIEQQSNKEKTIPYYTIPGSSDIQNATLLTSLIGIVPSKGGKLQQPLFPFSTIISRGDLMAANGMSLPDEIIGMKVGGFAYGVGSFLDNISCVRAYATSMLFVFKDGRYKNILDNSQQNSSTIVSNDSIGYLTDQYGNPCIKGEYKTNAPQVLSALIASGGIKGVGDAVAQWQQSTVYGQGGITQAPTGSISKYMAGNALSTGSNLAAEWLKDRVSDSFDIVYVPASYPVKSKGRVLYRPNRLMLHITKDILIDKSSTSRRLNYGQVNKAFDNRL